MSNFQRIPAIIVLAGMLFLLSGLSIPLATPGWASAAAAEPAALVIEPRTETFAGLTPDMEFPTELVVRGPGETVVLRTVGSGVRRQMIFKVYEAALYTDAAEDLGPDPFETLIEGDSVRHLTLRFLRDVTGAKVRDAIAEGFTKVLPNPDRQLLADQAQLLGYFEGGIKARETIELTLWPGKGLYTRVGREWREPIRNEVLMRAIMDIWLGEDPVSEELKQDLLRFETEG